MLFRLIAGIRHILRCSGTLNLLRDVHVEQRAFDLEDDVKALFEGEELSADFQNKARTIFEATIKSKIAIVKESLEAD